MSLASELFYGIEVRIYKTIHLAKLGMLSRNKPDLTVNWDQNKIIFCSISLFLNTGGCKSPDWREKKLEVE